MIIDIVGGRVFTSPQKPGSCTSAVSMVVSGFTVSLWPMIRSGSSAMMDSFDSSRWPLESMRLVSDGIFSSAALVSSSKYSSGYSPAFATTRSSTPRRCKVGTEVGPCKTTRSGGASRVTVRPQFCNEIAVSSVSALLQPARISGAIRSGANFFALVFSFF